MSWLDKLNRAYWLDEWRQHLARKRAAKITKKKPLPSAQAKEEFDWYVKPKPKDKEDDQKA